MLCFKGKQSLLIQAVRVNRESLISKLLAKSFYPEHPRVPDVQHFTSSCGTVGFSNILIVQPSAASESRVSAKFPPERSRPQPVLWKAKSVLASASNCHLCSKGETDFRGHSPFPVSGWETILELQCVRQAAGWELCRQTLLGERCPYRFSTERTCVFPWISSLQCTCLLKAVLLPVESRKGSYQVFN